MVFHLKLKPRRMDHDRRMPPSVLRAPLCCPFRFEPYNAQLSSAWTPPVWRSETGGVRVCGDGDRRSPRYLTELDRAGYGGDIVIEISVMVQRRPGYDPAAALAFKTLTESAKAGVELTHG